MGIFGKRRDPRELEAKEFTEEEGAQQQLQAMGMVAQGWQPPESSLEMNRGLIEPDFKSLTGYVGDFKDINKDLAISYLKEEELYFIRKIGDLIAVAKEFNCEISLYKLLRIEQMILASARSRQGFERKMLTTQTTSMDVNQQINRKKQGGFRLF